MSSVSGTPRDDSLEERHLRALEELERARERWELILETANDAYIAIDRRSSIIAWNPQAEALLGWSEEQALGSQLPEMVIPQRFRAAHREGIEHYLRTGEGPVLFERFELPALHRDGHEVATEITIWPSPDGDGERFNAFLHDIGERQRIQRDVQLQQRVTAAANATSDVENALSKALEDVCETIGWALGHAYVLDEDDHDRLVPADRWHLTDPSFERFRDVTDRTAFVRGKGLPGRVLASGEPAWIVDVVEDDNFPRFGIAEEVGLHTAMAFPVLSGDEVRAVLEFYSRERAEPDLPMLELMRTIGTQLGRVFERHHARRELQRANDELRESNELKARLVSVVSHELRSPLSAIHGFADLLQSDWEDTPAAEKREMVGSIERQARRLFRLVEDLLTLSRLESQAVEAKTGRVEVGAVIDAVLVDLGLAPEVEVKGPTDAVVLVDRDHLVQVLVNFLTNAGRYGEPPFVVEIRTGASDENGHVDLCVCDSGPGVPEGFVPRLFEPFTRAKATEGDGTGLGLSIVRGLVAANDGSTWYEDRDPGARFAVRLPRARPVGPEREEDR